MFEFTNRNCDLGNVSNLKRSESFSSLAPKIEELIPDLISEEKTSIFKNKIKFDFAKIT